jgi:hypothetical protein
MTPAGWGQPHPVGFNSADSDFDPYFAPDGRGVYFFSNRSGGLGKDDIYFVPFDPATQTYGAPRNLGPQINTAGNEWAPAVSNDGEVLLFSSDGRGGEGKQDLFFAAREGENWARAEALGAPVNGPNDDFDATFLPDDSGFVMTSGDLDGDGGTKLYLVLITPGGFTTPQEVGPEINCTGGLTLGPSLSRQEPGKLFFTSNCQKNGIGRMDIFRTPMPAYDWNREQKRAD